MTSWVQDATKRDLPSCPRCRVLPGDPCRTTSWRTRKPHREREECMPKHRGAQECLVHVYWSGLNDSGDKGKGHLLQRGKVMADLGLDKVPSPPFTDQEMQEIAFAAKMAALACLQKRKNK